MRENSKLELVPTRAELTLGWSYTDRATEGELLGTLLGLSVGLIVGIALI
jgi:hypothetical protein